MIRLKHLWKYKFKLQKQISRERLKQILSTYLAIAIMGEKFEAYGHLNISTSNDLKDRSYQ